MRKFTWMLTKQKAKIISHILFGKSGHFFMVYFSEKELIKLFKGEEFDVNIESYKAPPYIIHRMIKNVADNTSDIDMVCHKANFEAEAELFTKRNKGKDDPES